MSNRVSRAPLWARLAAAFTAVVLLGSPGRASAQGTNPPTLESLAARLVLLEQRVAELTAENATLKQARPAADPVSPRPAAAPAPAPEKKPAPPVVVTVSGKASQLTVGGLMQVQGETGEIPDNRFAGTTDRFQLRRLRASVAGAFTQDVSFKVEADFGNAGITGSTAARGQLTDAFMVWSGLPSTRIQAGQFKTPFGQEQLLADAKTLFVERTLSNDRLTVGRQIGMMVSGDLAENILTYSVGAFNGSGTNVGFNDNNQFMRVGRLTATLPLRRGEQPPLRCNFGVNYFAHDEKSSSFTGERTGFGAHAQLTGQAFEVGGEWLLNEYESSAGARFKAAGWYFYTACLITPKWQWVARWDNYDSNTGLPNTTVKEWTLGINYLLRGDDLKLSLGYIRGDQPDPLPSGGRLIGRMQVVF